jgi:hypothetical protein
VDDLRAALGQGKLVRVGIAPSSQFPDGLTGRVRRIGDPAVDGDEFIFVEVPVGGAKDVLPFAAADLTGPPVRKRTAASSEPSSGAVSRPRGPAKERVSSTTPSPMAPSSGTPDPAVGQPVRPAAAPPPAPPTPRTNAAARGKRPPVSITISTAGDESASWRIEAKIGAKTAVRPTSIPPSRVWEIVQSLGEPRLTDLVQHLLDDHRRSTQAKADALAAQLSALQAELRTFPQG